MVLLLISSDLSGAPLNKGVHRRLFIGYMVKKGFLAAAGKGHKHKQAAQNREKPPPLGLIYIK
jgi:hypothetical protein